MDLRNIYCIDDEKGKFAGFIKSESATEVKRLLKKNYPGYKIFSCGSTAQRIQHWKKNECYY